MITETPSGSAAAVRSLPGLQARVHANLRDAGFSEAASSALMAFDIDQFSYVRRVMKGEVPLTLLRDLGAGVEATQFHALTAITRIECGIGRQVPVEATVGLLAEEMNVDPSRASRIAADLVERGYLARAASQRDGRRSVLTLTDEAKALFQAFRDLKCQQTISVFKDWPEADILDFARLFARYTDDMRRLYSAQTDARPPGP